MSESVDAKQWDVRLPDAKAPLHPSHLRQPPSWIAFMREMDAEWQRYMRDHDAPEHRLATKLQTRFKIGA